MTRLAASKHLLLLTVMYFVFATTGVNASVISLNPAASGEITDFFDQGLGQFFPGIGWIYIRQPSHTYSVDAPLSEVSYTFGGCNSACGSEGGTWTSETRGYWIFDLSSLNSTLVSATLDLQLSSSSDVDISFFGLDSVSTSALNTLSAVSNPGQIQRAFGDIGSGTSYGSMNFSSSGPGAYSAALNAQALSDINQGSGLFAVGASLTSGIDRFNAESVFIPNASLKLVEAASSVPVPAPIWLFVPALLGLGFINRK